MNQIKTKIILAIVITASMIAISIPLYQYHYYHTPHEIDLSSYPHISENEITYSIEKLIPINRDYNYITGYVYANNHSNDIFNTKLVFYHDDSDEAMYMPLNMVTRTDIVSNEQEFDYTYCGFEGYIPHTIDADETSLLGFLIMIDDSLTFVKTNKTYTVVE